MPICRDVTEMATDYVEGALSPRRRLAVRLHLAACSMCRAYFDQMRKASRLLRGRAMPPPAPETEARILAAAEAAPPGPREET